MHACMHREIGHTCMHAGEREGRKEGQGAGACACESVWLCVSMCRVIDDDDMLLLLLLLLLLLFWTVCARLSLHQQQRHWFW